MRLYTRLLLLLAATALVLALSGPVLAQVVQQPPPSATQPYLNVKDFGARGDGATDDTVAIQQALNAVPPTPNGGVVFFPPGIYPISDDLQVTKSNTTLLGMGAGVSTLKIGTFWNTPPFSGSVPAMVNLFGQQTAHIAHIQVQGLHFMGSPNADANEPKCVSCLFADDVTIEGNLFENFGHECIWPAGNNTSPSQHWRITQNHFTQIGLTSSSPSAVTINGRDFLVAMNTFDTVLGAIGASEQRAVITGNLIKNVTAFGISVAGDDAGADDIVVSANQIQVTAGSQLRYGIGVIDGARNVVIADNAIRVQTVAGAFSPRGIRLQGPHEGALIHGNTILLDATGLLQSGHNLIGIDGFDNGHTLDVVLANNLIRLVNENTFYTVGIHISPTSATDVVKAVFLGNTVKGFSRLHGAYAFDLNNTAGGTFTYATSGDITDGGYIRFPDIFITDASQDNVPIYKNSRGVPLP
jgi:hypothetical protein